MNNDKKLIAEVDKIVAWNAQGYKYPGITADEMTRQILDLIKSEKKQAFSDGHLDCQQAGRIDNHTAYAQTIKSQQLELIKRIEGALSAEFYKSVTVQPHQNINEAWAEKTAQILNQAKGEMSNKVPQDKEVEELLRNRIVTGGAWDEAMLKGTVKDLETHYRKKFADELLARLPEEKVKQLRNKPRSRTDYTMYPSDGGYNQALAEIKKLIKEVTNETTI